MKRTQLIATTLIVTTVVITGVVVVRGKRNEFVTTARAASPPPAVAVQTTTVERRDVARLLTLPGDIMPIQEATLYAKVSGYVSDIKVDKGDRVTANQLLAVISAPELDAERSQAMQQQMANLATAKGSAALSLKNVEEQQQARVGAEKAKADVQQVAAAVEKARADVKQYRANVDKSKAELSQAESDLSKSRIKLTQAQIALRQAQDEKTQAQANADECAAQLQKAAAELDAAKANQQLAELTYQRYKGIYDKDSGLIAKQDVDKAESEAKATKSRTEAAKANLDAVTQRVKAAQAAMNIAERRIETAQSQIESAKEDITIATGKRDAMTKALEVAQAQAQASEQQANVVEAQRNAAEKQARVAEKQIDIVRRQQDVVKAQADAANYQASASRALVSKTSIMSDYRDIRAPFAGIITQRHVDKGALIQTATTSQNAKPVVSIADISTVRIYVYVPENEVSFVKAGSVAKVIVKSLPNEGSGQRPDPIMGKVARIASAIDVKTRTMLAEVDVFNADRTLLPGMMANVSIVLETHKNVVSIPSAALGVEKAGKFVFVVESGKAQKVTVTTGFDDGAFVEIVEGLKGGEEIVVVGRDALMPDAPVTTTKWAPTKSK